MAREGHTAWVCVDCYYAHHGFPEDEDYPPAREPLSLIGDHEVTAGLLADGHIHDCPNFPMLEDGTRGDFVGTDCDCERVSFSWSPCQGCGSPLGGEREALTVWERVA